MDPLHLQFLQALRAALRGEQTVLEGISSQNYAQMLELAQDHHVLPLFFDATYRCEVASSISPEILTHCRQAVLHTVTAQSIRSENLLELFNKLQALGLQPLVVKGIVCRQLYPLPDYRASGDEDLLCPPDQFEAMHQALLSMGMVPQQADLSSYEVPYIRPDGGLYIELHKSLFPQQEQVLGQYNALFEQVFAHPQTLQIQGSTVHTLSPTDHLLYLIVHAYKHFLHSGFGIRQVCDITLFANTYGPEIDWDHVYTACRGIRAHKFAAAIFAIGREYLTFDPEKACFTPQWAQMDVQIKPLLEDLLTGGIYGSSDRSRLHSSTMTMSAVSAGKQKGIAGTLFPKAETLQNRYPYLQRKPYLLPVAWVQRFISFGKETKNRTASPSKALQEGNRRIALLRKYDIID